MINKITLLFTLITTSTLNAQTIFDWETAIDNGDNITQTISGTTATFTGPTINTSLLDIGGIGGTSGNTVLISTNESSATEVTFSFNVAVDVSSILALEGNQQNIDYIFTPTGGSNTSVTASLVNGVSSVNLNWTDVTSFTVTSTGAWFGFDDLLVNNLTTSTHNYTVEKIEIFPNPSSDYLQVSGLNEIQDYHLYNISGSEIGKGVVSNNEKINIKNLTNGLYILKFEDGKTIKFSKK